MFIGLGWDEDETTKRKHYRSFYPDELENNKEIFPKPSPFDTYEIKRGQSRGANKGLFSFSHQHKKDASGELSNEKVAGIFKAIIHVQSKEAKDAFHEKKDQMIKKIVQLVKEYSTKH